MIVRFWIQQNVLYHTAKNFGVVFNIHGSVLAASPGSEGPSDDSTC